jgi:hypothetical protein
MERTPMPKRQSLPETCASVTPQPEADIFLMRVNAIGNILEEMEPIEQAYALALLFGEHLGMIPNPASRSKIRKAMIDDVDTTTRETAAYLFANAKTEAAIQRRVGSLDLTPDVSTTIN